MVKKLIPLVLLFSISLLAGLPFLHAGLSPTHDGEYHVVRFYEFDKVLRSGVWYPRWAPDFNNGYGIPLFNFVYPLPNYIASLLHALGFSFIDSFKISMFLAVVLGTYLFYTWARIFWGIVPGIASSVVYTYSPYHFVDMYVRGSIGEVWSLAIFPGFLWAITEYINKNDKKYFFLSVLFLALLIFSHNILGFVFFLFSIVYVFTLFISKKENKKMITTVGYIFILSLLLSAIFWMPALLEKQYVRGLEIFNVRAHFPELFQLVFPSWGTGFSGNTLEGQMSFQVGVVNLIAIFISSMLVFKTKQKHKRIAIFVLISSYITLFLMVNYSSFIWEKISFMRFFQFPWRLLSLEILLSSFLVGYVCSYMGTKTFIKIPLSVSALIAALFIIFSVVLTYPYTQPAYYHIRDDFYYTSRPNFVDGTNSPGNVFNTIWMDTNIKKNSEKVRVIEGKAQVSRLAQDFPTSSFIVIAEKRSLVEVNIAYFPGWEVYNAGKKISFSYPKGIIQFPMERGEHTIKILFSDTAIRKVAKYLSICSFFLVFALFIKFLYVKIRR